MVPARDGRSAEPASDDSWCPLSGDLAEDTVAISQRTLHNKDS